MHIYKHPLLLGLTLLLTTAPLFGAKTGESCLFIGHSFFVPVAKAMKPLAGKANLPTHRQAEVFSGGQSGSPGKLWQNQEKRAAIEKILQTGKVDLLGMTYFSPADSSAADYQRWIDLALQHNPKTRFFIGLPWGKNGATRPLREYEAKNQMAQIFISTFTESLRKKYPNNHFTFLNYGMASVELKRHFEAGTLPDVKAMVSKKVPAVYTDPMGHAGQITKDLAALTWLRALYGIELNKNKLNLSYQTDLCAIATAIVDKHPRLNTQKKAR